MELNNVVIGNVKISEEVISAIVKNVLAEIEGVHSLALKPVSPAEVLKNSSAMKPVAISVEAEVAAIDIAINLCYGYRLKAVADQIQRRVKDAVQDMTGITVSKVNVYVAGIKEKAE